MVALPMAQAILAHTTTTKWLLQLQLVAVLALLLAAAVVLVAVLATARAARAGALPRLSTGAAQARLSAPSEDMRLAVTRQHQLQRKCVLRLGFFCFDTLCMFFQFAGLKRSVGVHPTTALLVLIGMRGMHGPLDGCAHVHA
jgi:hypothetical protein